MHHSLYDLPHSSMLDCDIMARCNKIKQATSIVFCMLIYTQNPFQSSNAHFMLMMMREDRIKLAASPARNVQTVPEWTRFMKVDEYRIHPLVLTF